MRDTFPEQLNDVTAEEFWRSVNAVRPDHIRVEADELTYDLHIILRAEIEAEVMTGAAKVEDLPGMWADRMRLYLDRDVPSDTLGVVHWSHGYVGSFPTYTLGNVMAAQFFGAALKQDGVVAGLDRADYAPLRKWLTDNIYRHGRSRTPTEVLQRATQGPLDIRPYVAALAGKVAILTRQV